MSYAPLPTKDLPQFYMLALKLKDMQILESSDKQKQYGHKKYAKLINLHICVFRGHSGHELADENHKLKAEIENLAVAIDSIMRDKDNQKLEMSASQSIHPDQDLVHEFDCLKGELKEAHRVINSKTQLIKDLEYKINDSRSPSSPGSKENRYVRFEDNPYRKDAYKPDPNLMRDLDNILANIESVLFKYEGLQTSHLSLCNTITSNDFENMGPNDHNIRDFCNRLSNVQKIVEKLIQNM